MNMFWKPLLLRLSVGTLFALVLSAGLLPLHPSKVQAAGCYDQAFNLPQITLNSGAYYSTPTYQTSVHCNDINFRFTSDSPAGYSNLIDLRVCFIRSSGAISCNAWTFYPDYAWHTPATGVLDNTRYYLQFHNIALSTISFNSQVAD